jgi:hypothetical protein
LRVGDMGFEIWGSGFRVAGSGFQISGFGFRVYMGTSLITNSPPP